MPLAHEEASKRTPQILSIHREERRTEIAPINHARTTGGDAVRPKKERIRWKDSIGRVFGRLTVLKVGETDASLEGHRRVLCRCACGKAATVRSSDLSMGRTVSCGCFHIQRIKECSTTHGLCSTAEYEVWAGIIQRTTNTKRKDFIHYGGRGITCCPQWRHSFETFLADTGLRPSPDHCIERIDNNKGYFPGNVRYATQKEQCRNQRRNRLIECFGKTQTLAEWAEQTGIAEYTLRGRINRGWTLDQTMTKSLRKTKPRFRSSRQP